MDGARSRGIVARRADAGRSAAAAAGADHPRRADGGRAAQRRYGIARIEAPSTTRLEQLETMRVREGSICAPISARARRLLADSSRGSRTAADTGRRELEARLLRARQRAHGDCAGGSGGGRAGNRARRAALRHQRGGDALPRPPRALGRAVDGPEPCGRKLDFLLQEMNREVNTIGSKADGLRVSELIDQGQGRARTDAGAGPECRVSARGLLFIVSAPSGTGKTTLVERLVQVLPNLRMSRSYTSRQARAGERDGVDYNFVSREQFEAMIEDDAFLEWADVFGNLLWHGARRRRGAARSGAGRRARHRRARRPAGQAARRRSHRDLRAAAVVSRRWSSGCADGARTPRSRCSAASARARAEAVQLRSTTTTWCERRARADGRAAAGNHRGGSARGPHRMKRVAEGIMKTFHS